MRKLITLFPKSILLRIIRENDKGPGSSTLNYVVNIFYYAYYISEKDLWSLSGIVLVSDASYVDVIFLSPVVHGLSLKQQLNLQFFINSDVAEKRFSHTVTSLLKIVISYADHQSMQCLQR